MLEHIRKYPIAYAIVVALLFLYNPGLVWFEKVWDALFPGESFPVWFAKWVVSKGWKGMSPYLSASLLTVSTLGTFTLLGVILQVVLKHRREVGWLEAIADGDHQAMSQRIHIGHITIKDPDFNSIAPSVDIEIEELLNVSVFTITLGEVEGRVHFNGTPLQLPIEIIIKGRDSLCLKHGGHYPFILRQHFSHDAARQMLQEKEPQFSTRNIALWFTYQDHSGNFQRARVAIG
jgi:hypothetical protein